MSEGGTVAERGGEPSLTSELLLKKSVILGWEEEMELQEGPPTDTSPLMQLKEGLAASSRVELEKETLTEGNEEREEGRMEPPPSFEGGAAAVFDGESIRDSSSRPCIWAGRPYR